MNDQIQDSKPTIEQVIRRLRRESHGRFDQVVGEAERLLEKRGTVPPASKTYGGGGQGSCKIKTAVYLTPNG